ncbi:DUF1127 domain-containing protein [Variovorax paradoxus]|nr:DUF1127 domain-containing protein [Variovorax paradoxus]
MGLKMRLPILDLAHALAGRIARANDRRRARHEAQQLKAMSEHELLDLGIGRSEVPALLRGTAGRLRPRNRRS